MAYVIRMNKWRVVLVLVIVFTVVAGVVFSAYLISRPKSTTFQRDAKGNVTEMTDRWA